MTKLREIERRMLESALKGMQSAYLLWGFAVGAAVLGEGGQVYEGCNVESWVSGLGICAERSAVNHAILHGNRKIKGVATVGLASELEDELWPCGMCLQYIFDLAESPRIIILTAKAEKTKILFETVQMRPLEKLLPLPFKK